MSRLTNHRRESVLTGLWHDYANLFPMLDAAGQDALRLDVQEHGVREPVVIYGDRILDGRNRYMAARDLGLDFPVADFDGTDAEALSYVLSTNLHRRHLTESQRGNVAAKLANMKRTDTLVQNRSANLPDGDAPVSQAQAAELLNVSERTVRAARAVQETAPELVPAVEAGEIAVSLAAKVAELPPEERAAVAAAPEGERRKAAREAVKRQKPAKEPAKPRAGRELTREALEEDLAALREENARLKAALAEKNARIADLEAHVAELSHSETGQVISRLREQRDRERTAKGRKMDELAVMARKLRAADARIAELERARREEVVPL